MAVAPASPPARSASSTSTRCRARRRSARCATTGSKWGSSPRARRRAPPTRSSSGRSQSSGGGLRSGPTSSRRGAPHWTWFIILYFFVGGIAGGACFLAAILDWFGRTEDRPVVRTGYYVAAWGAILCGLLLTVDLGQPLRFWHMLVQSHNFPAIMFKAWSPISFGAWVVLAFGAFSVLSALGVMAEEGRIASPALRAMHRGALGKLVAGISALLGFSLAGYTGILLSVTNRPIWADSPWLGALFLASGASTGAATLILLAPGRGATERSLAWLSSFDSQALVVELLVLVVFLGSLGSVNRVWAGF